MFINVDLDFHDRQGKGILAEAETQGITAGELINKIFSEFDLLGDDGLLDYLDELADKHEIPEEDYYDESEDYLKVNVDIEVPVSKYDILSKEAHEHGKTIGEVLSEVIDFLDAYEDGGLEEVIERMKE